MADDNNSRYRPSDPFGRGPAPAGPASDPLAELARLIGQSDPFSDYGRETRPAGHDSARQSANPAPPFGSEPAPQYSNGPTPQYGQEPARHYASEPPQQYAQEPAQQRYAGDYPPRHADNRQPLDDWPGTPAPPPPPSFLTNDPFALPSQQQHAPQPGRLPFDSQSYTEPLGRPGPDSYPADPPGFDSAGYPSAPDRQSFSQPPLYPHEPEAGSMPPPHDDEFYDDAPRDGRRKGLLTVAAVLGLAVVGTVGAFGYRSMFGGSGASSPPPVIRASGEPSKVAPPPTNTDQSANKFSYDRFSDANKDEQVVRREERPVDSVRPNAPPRTVLPGAPVVTTPPARPGTTAGANPPSAIGEPRRVRTVPIRPEQADIAASAPLATEPAPVAPSRQANAVAPSRSTPAAAEPQQQAPPPVAARAASSRASSRVAVRSAPAPASSPAPTANAPLSLSPDANNAPLPPPSAPQSVAPPRAAPTRVASAPTTGGGGYLVQVSSQRSEADAQSSFRSIQSKYSSVLGNQPHLVRRADLGSKGVYYRAMVGPFSSREQAIQLCSSLKQAGGDCVVQH